MIFIFTEGHQGGQTGIAPSSRRKRHNQAPPLRLAEKNGIFCGNCRRQAFAFHARL
ncbi:hypothetical protein [Sinorhizobium americanum]|uniref:Uncharacterized protein n=1 Tax=Sinorhizobium americanum TaxID=194963 RepID=A0A1L3LN21_9HYPH|nr:hypothetical protein [Sinorhizobium americanum]APG84831.1 hypothetical protein SAMCCGM7_Ch2086 [Sinorhizobium americanum CCGM7]APG91474.1 hypothetical protein SAMCFNEI73_Ch2191 [Sinorhizobium americanum]